MGDAAYFVLLVGGLGALVLWKGRFERARVRERTMGAEPLIDRLRLVARPAALLIPSAEVVNLPASIDWPTGVNGAMRFVVVVHLAAARPAAIDWLPKTGELHVFCDRTLHDGPEFARVLYVARDQPQSSDEAGQIGARRIRLQPVRSLPSSVWLGLQDDFGASFEGVDGTRLSPQGPHHQLGGYPDEIQNEHLARSCAQLAAACWSLPSEPEAWRLLVQVDSDPDLDLEFGDGGRLFVFVREQDAKACDFSRTISIWQSY